jgi:hypothetical protein
LQFGASFVNLRVRDLSALSGRSEYVCRRTFRQLVIERRVRFGDRRGDTESGLGLFYSLPNPLNPFERVFFPTQKGWDEALRRGFVDHTVSVTDEKSEGQLEHDLILTDFHKALHFAYGAKLHWSQLFKARKHRWSDRPNDYVNADAFFYLELPNGEYASFFVEVENQKGVEEPMRKMGNYLGFADGPFQDLFHAPDFRVIFLRPSAPMVTNLAAATHRDKTRNSPRFWIADYASSQRPTERVFFAPPDYERKAWSFHDLAA